MAWIRIVAAGTLVGCFVGVVLNEALLQSLLQISNLCLGEGGVVLSGLIEAKFSWAPQ